MSIRDIGFCLDVRRLFVRRVSANVCNLIIENVAQPIAVALVVVFAFLNRVDPFHFSTNFIYFTTLYAFWVGMFGSCQSLNTELRNGEWSYWILGLGRNRIVHLLAICFTNLLFAFLQIALFVGTILAFKYLVSFHSGFGLEAVYRNFVNCFVSCTKDKSALFQMQGLLKLYLEHMMPGRGSEVFAFGIFSFSLVSAVISGVGFGVLFSTLFRDPVVSLNVSVGFVVVIGMLSYVSLKDGQGGEEEKFLDREFNLSIIRDCNGAMKGCRPSNLLSALSLLSQVLPQRYFYNMGSLTFPRNSCRLEAGSGFKYATGLVVEKYFSTNDTPFWLECVLDDREPSIASDNSGWKLLRFKDKDSYLDQIDNSQGEACVKSAASYEKDIPDKMRVVQAVFSKALAEDRGLLDRLQLNNGLRLILFALWSEFKRLLLMFVACVLATVVMLYKKESYNALR